jgi:hypothetical protein
MDKITVIEFATQVPPWRSGEKAGFPHETAMAYVNRGLAKIVAAHVDRVDARTRQADAERRLAELRLLADSAQAEAAFHRAAADRGETL